MKSFRLLGKVALVLVGLSAIAAAFFAEATTPAKLSREALTKLVNDGNFKDAYEGLRVLAVDPKSDPLLVGQDLNMAVSCLENLGRVDEIDELRESIIAAHPKNWRLLLAAANSYSNHQGYGSIVAGKFYRGPHRAGGKYVSSLERDRARALQLMVQAMPLVDKEPKKNEAAEFYFSLARILMANREHFEAWRLQTLTDLTTLPDY
ncbi:MAG: hypothetical protein SGJ20_13320, partial [Planctomycetota bacterium]|nr:hypothetical protein [Planctomycetota bacterium]